MKRAYVFFNGELTGEKEFYIEILKTEGDIYCADGGAMHLYDIGGIPLEIMGDMDSVSTDVLDFYRGKGTKIKTFCKDKDFTDGEIILEYLDSKGYEEIIVFAATGGRTDHMLTNFNLLFKYKQARFVSDKEEIMTIDKMYSFNEAKGTTVSFIPFSEEVTGVTLTGFKFPLNEYTLRRGSSICMSNIIAEVNPEISFENGSLLCVIEKN
jgi:thiamine pyrophosphokinase